MVHHLIDHLNLGPGFINLKGHTDDFAWSKTEKASMKEWNSLALAVAYKRNEILSYFLQDRLASLRLFGQRPASEVGDKLQAENQSFLL